MTLAKRRATARRQAATFKALGHPARMLVISELAAGERCVCDLVDLLGLGWSTVSRHLAVLRAVGLVTDQKRGLQVFYRFKLPCVTRLAECLDAVERGKKVTVHVGC